MASTRPGPTLGQCSQWYIRTRSTCFLLRYWGVSSTRVELGLRLKASQPQAHVRDFAVDLILSMNLNFGKKFVIFNMYLILSMTTEIVSEGVDIKIVALTSQLW